MAQVKVHGRRDVWAGRQREISDLLQACLVEAWGLPEDKRFHRFFLLDEADWIVPGRDARYLIVEIVCFEGRGDAGKRALIRSLYDRVVPALGITADDLELTIIETPRQNWGIRGMAGDELTLTYSVTPPDGAG
ncbi:Tautomerase enzyme [Actinomadura rubteroloni]|uniref:Tautomerase enzyme n=1 Tax=Actinomadura rubteroloni TaxID=1926885 RepID=A0A2P4UMC6_9ACTN|nr:tautomerase family protein [Actinomadura rubteroloni]POM26203.1 Tautomerase enzyme [Actinomadura rubteroloni]